MIYIQFPKMFKRFGYDVEEPGVIRRKKIRLACMKNKQFGMELESFGRRLPPLMLSTDCKTRKKLKKVRQDFMWYVHEGKWL